VAVALLVALRAVAKEVVGLEFAALPVALALLVALHAVVKEVVGLAFAAVRVKAGDGRWLRFVVLARGSSASWLAGARPWRGIAVLAVLARGGASTAGLRCMNGV
jgi:hypothetical protein